MSEVEQLREALGRSEALAQEWRDTAESYRVEVEVLRTRLAAALKAHAATAGSDPKPGASGERGDDASGEGGPTAQADV